MDGIICFVLHVGYSPCQLTAVAVIFAGGTRENTVPPDENQAWGTYCATFHLAFFMVLCVHGHWLNDC